MEESAEGAASDQAPDVTTTASSLSSVSGVRNASANVNAAEERFGYTTFLGLEDAAEKLGRAGQKLFVGHQKPIMSVGWSTDGVRLASGSSDQTIRIWPVVQEGVGSSTAELKGHESGILNLKWSPKHADVLASGSRDCSIRLWDARSVVIDVEVIKKNNPAILCTTYKATSKTELNGGEILNLCWSQDGNLLCAADNNDLLSIIDVRKNHVLARKKFPSEVNEMATTPDSNLLLVTSGSGEIKVFTFPELEELHTCTAHPANIFCIAVDPRGRYFAVGGADAVTSLWDLESFTCIDAFQDLEYQVRSVGLSFDGAYVAFGSEDEFIEIVDVESGECVHYVDTSGATNGVAWNPNNYLLAFAGEKKDKTTTDFPVVVFGFPPQV